MDQMIVLVLQQGTQQPLVSLADGRGPREVIFLGRVVRRMRKPEEAEAQHQLYQPRRDEPQHQHFHSEARSDEPAQHDDRGRSQSQ